MPSAPSRDTAEPAWLLLFAGWLVAAAATLGALFFSEVMQVPPCVLCWYQRICMFPLVLLLGLALFPLDARVVRYALPLALIGLGVAVFHLLLVAGIVPERMSPCVQGVPCTEVHVRWFGVVTIPLLSAAAFLALAVLLVLAYRKASR